MVVIAERNRYLQESIIGEISIIASEEDAIDLSGSEVECSVHRELQEAAAGVFSDSFTMNLQSALDNLRKQAAEDLNSRSGDKYNNNDIIITSGVNEALFVALAALLNPGEEVILFEPCNERYLPAVIMAGGIPISIEIQPPKWDFWADSLLKAITSKTKAIILNQPMNPCGKVFNYGELSMIDEISSGKDIAVIYDETCRKLYYNTPGDYIITKGTGRRTITFGSFADTFALTGWNIGYCASKGELGTAIKKIHNHTFAAAPNPLHAVLCKAGENLTEDHYGKIRNEYLRKRDLFCYGLLDLGFKLEIPKGGRFVFADFTGIFDGDDVEFVGFLLVEKGVAAAPGSSFYIKGCKGKNMVRFNFSITEQKLIEALDRIGARINSLTKIWKSV